MLPPRLAVLGSHTLLARVAAPMIQRTTSLGLRDR
jgi:hypothetical protein